MKSLFCPEICVNRRQSAVNPCLVQFSVPSKSGLGFGRLQARSLIDLFDDLTFYWWFRDDGDSADQAAAQCPVCCGPMAEHPTRRFFFCHVCRISA